MTPHDIREQAAQIAEKLPCTTFKYPGEAIAAAIRAIPLPAPVAQDAEPVAAELVEWLRAYADFQFGSGGPTAHSPNRFDDAANALTDLAAQVQQLTAERDVEAKERDAARNTVIEQRARAETAEAKLAEARAALKQILHDSDTRLMREHARAALASAKEG